MERGGMHERVYRKELRRVITTGAEIMDQLLAPKPKRRMVRRARENAATQLRTRHPCPRLMARQLAKPAKKLGGLLGGLPTMRPLSSRARPEYQYRRAR
jgi:hypothetical protein